VPIYEYRCKKCGKQFEYMQRMTEGPKRKCEACGALALERLISQTSFHLKGGGWYKDLYASAKPGASSGSDAGSASDSGAAGGSDAASGTGSGTSSEAKAKPAEKSGSTSEKKTPKKKGSA
jgi:putative FmdB family regulatory protein